jgi:hypothetical protein
MSGFEEPEDISLDRDARLGGTDGKNSDETCSVSHVAVR